MANYYQQPHSPPYGAPSAQNLQFFPSTYSPAPVSGHATPSQAAYGYGGGATSAGYGGPSGFNSGFSAAPVSGRMGEQGGLRTGWLAAFGTEGYDGEPPLLEELGVNFGHIQSKVSAILPAPTHPLPHLEHKLTYASYYRLLRSSTPLPAWTNT
jgi:hypothetical protein